jgi:hypothetical protein
MEILNAIMARRVPRPKPLTKAELARLEVQEQT